MSLYLCDSNVWLALAVAAHVHHAAVQDWFASVTEPASALLCRSTQQSFLRLLTNSTIYARHGLRPRTNSEAWAAYVAVLSDDRVAFRTEEPPGLERLWFDFASRNTASPKLWMDAYLAVFARAASLTFVTTDRAFRQFDGLDVIVLGEGSAPEPS